MELDPDHDSCRPYDQWGRKTFTIMEFHSLLREVSRHKSQYGKREEVATLYNAIYRSYRIPGRAPQYMLSIYKKFGRFLSPNEFVTTCLENDMPFCHSHPKVPLVLLQSLVKMELPQIKDKLRNISEMVGEDL